MYGNLCREASMLVMLGCWLCSASAASANVNLEWRLETSGLVRTGDTVRIGLFAVSNDATNQSMATLDVIFSWDPVFLQLVRIDNNGPYNWLKSELPLGDPFGLNEAVPPQDGDGLYLAQSQIFGAAAEATPAPGGLLVTTFEFTARASTCNTPVSVLTSGGTPLTFTIVTSAVDASPITGTLGQIALDIGSATSLDCNINGIPDECDIANGTSPDCNANGIPDECEPDTDGDGVIDPCDNCVNRPNPDQADSNGDGYGDVCPLRPAPPETYLPPVVSAPPNSEPTAPPADGSDMPGVQEMTGNCAPMQAATMSMSLVGLLLMQWTHRRRRKR